jgi:hypothetical protein
MKCGLPVKGDKSMDGNANEASEWLDVFDEISDLICITDKEYRIVKLIKLWRML